MSESLSDKRAYFDWNATAPLRPEARNAILAAFETVGNPSSVHAEGRAARALVETARAQVAELIGADPRGVIFTSGGTEANMLALIPAIEVDGVRNPRGGLFVTTIEHPSVRAGGRFGAVIDLPVKADGIVCRQSLEQRLVRAEHPLVSVMFVNNETGIIQPIREVAGITHAAGGLLHVDAVQAAGKISCDIKVLSADLMTVSGHKLGGPQGTGALVLRDGIHITDQLLKGGGQERGARAGTENVAGIAGFGAACAAAVTELAATNSRLSALRGRLEAQLRDISPAAVIFGEDVARVPNTTLVALPGLKAETAVIAFDLAGVAVSSGSACSSGKVAASHVLAAMGIDPALARGAIRLSLGWSTTEVDIDRLLNAWTHVVSSLSKGRTTDIAA
jgi:cysteine desulfurase